MEVDLQGSFGRPHEEVTFDGQFKVTVGLQTPHLTGSKR